MDEDSIRVEKSFRSLSSDDADPGEIGLLTKVGNAVLPDRISGNAEDLFNPFITNISCPFGIRVTWKSEVGPPVAFHRPPPRELPQ